MQPESERLFQGFRPRALLDGDDGLAFGIAGEDEMLLPAAGVQFLFGLSQVSLVRPRADTVCRREERCTGRRSEQSTATHRYGASR
jgi:hypothetical protein